MFLALRDLWYARGRFVLVGLVIGLVALMATLLSGLANGLVDDGVSGLRSLPMTHLAFQPDANSTFSRSTLHAANLEPWVNADGVEASALGMSFFNARTDDGTAFSMALFGVPPDSFMVPAGEAQDSLEGEPGLILSDHFRELGLVVGDEVTVVGADIRLPILGFTFAGSYGHVDIAFSTLETWQELMYGDRANGRFSAIAIKADESVDPAPIATAAETVVVTKVDAYQGSPGYAAEMQTMSLIRSFLLAVSALIVGAFFTVWTVQRTGEIGVLKALGASTSYVVRDALGQMAIVLGLSTVIGTLLGVGLGQFAGSSVPFRLEAGPILSSVVLLIGFGLLGCLIAIRRIAAVDPIVALRSRV